VKRNRAHSRNVCGCVTADTLHDRTPKRCRVLGLTVTNQTINSSIDSPGRFLWRTSQDDKRRPRTSVDGSERKIVITRTRPITYTFPLGRCRHIRIPSTPFPTSKTRLFVLFHTRGNDIWSTATNVTCGVETRNVRLLLSAIRTEHVRNESTETRLRPFRLNSRRARTNVTPYR